MIMAQVASPRVGCTPAATHRRWHGAARAGALLGRAYWVLALMLAPCHAAVDQQILDRIRLLDLPHVDDCSMCIKCHVTATPDPPVNPAEAVHVLSRDSFRPLHDHDKQTKPFCEECHGCTHHLEVLASHGSKNIFGRTFSDEAGASPNWLFKANTSETAAGRAIVKLACIPVGKLPGQGPPQCHPDLTQKHAKIYLAIEKISEDCGFTDIVPKVWVQKVSAVLPKVGYHIKWHAVWMGIAPGISLENVVRLGTPPMHPNDLLQFMHTQLNKSQVVLAAIFDLMTSQCDRHAQNIFLNDDGQVTLIDNERAFFESHVCGVDSILLPTTKKFAINVFENAWVNKFRDWGNKVPQSWANPPLLLDYRCHAARGVIGKDWPPKVAQCLQKFASLSVEQIQAQYGMPDVISAQALKNRTQAMWEHGFEDALTFGYPRNPNAWRYKFPEPCCEIIHTDTYRCANKAWKPDTSLPFGDPIGGGPWTRAWKDVGSYEGGSVF